MIKNSLVSAIIMSGFFSQPVIAQEQMDPEALFNEAMQYREDGEIFRAIELFETILKNQPELGRARLELAVSYHKTRKYAEAREQLTKVLNAPDTPEAVKLTVTAYLAQLTGDMKAAEKRTSSSVYLSVGLFSDSNINLGPDNNRDFPAFSVSAKESGTGSQLMISYAHRSRASKPLDLAGGLADFEWHTQATAYSKAHGSGDSDFNLGVISLSTGPAILKDKSWRAAFNIKLDKIYYGNDPYSDQLGINPVFTWILSEDMELSFGNTTTVIEHDDAAVDGLDGTSTIWDINASKFYPNQLIGVQAGIKYYDNGAEQSNLHYVGPEIYLGGQMPAWTDARAFLTLSGRKYDYQGPETGGNTRDETEISAVLGVSHDFRSGFLKSWTLNAQYTYSDSDSNIDAFDYDRNVFEVNLRRYFF